jgi:hypothetical protein
MYKIVGNDGKTYGPVPAEKIREWIAQGRVDSRTPALAEGAADWTFIGLLPEFAQNFNAAPPLTALTPPKTNTVAVWSLVCGILAWVPCCCCIPFNLVGLILSLVALVQLSGQPQPAGRGFAIAGLALSAASLLFSFGFSLVNLLAGQPKLFLDIAHS